MGTHRLSRSPSPASRFTERRFSHTVFFHSSKHGSLQRATHRAGTAHTRVAKNHRDGTDGRGPEPSARLAAGEPGGESSTRGVTGSGAPETAVLVPGAPAGAHAAGQGLCSSSGCLPGPTQQGRGLVLSTGYKVSCLCMRLCDKNYQ